METKLQSSVFERLIHFKYVFLLCKDIRNLSEKYQLIDLGIQDTINIFELINKSIDTTYSQLKN